MISKKAKAGLVVIPVLGLMLAGAGVASAHGFGGNFMGQKIDPDKLVEMEQTRFEQGAELLGISVDQFKAKWAEGKNLKEIASDLGIDEATIQTKMKAQREQEMQDRLSTLVEKGVITQAQADQRLTFMKSHEPGSGAGFGKGQDRQGGGMNRISQ